MPRLYVYSRVSTFRQMAGHGLTGQDEARERWLADNQKKYDLELVEDYRDLGTSGRGKNVTEGKMGLIRLDRRFHSVAKLNTRIPPARGYMSPPALERTAKIRGASGRPAVFAADRSIVVNAVDFNPTGRKVRKAGVGVWG